MNRDAINRTLNKIPTHLIIIIILIVWIVPTLGLLVTSFRPLPLINTSGWWTAFSANTTDTNSVQTSERFTIDNYIDALVGYRGTKTYRADCATGTQSLDLKCNLSDLLNPRGMGRAFINSILVTVPSVICLSFLHCLQPMPFHG